MEINNVKAMEGASGSQNTKAQPVDSVSKNIQNEISDVQRKRQELSSKEDISVEEKQKKRQEMQQEISRLNAQLRQRQAEMRREKQQKELLSEEMKKDSDKTKEAGPKKVETKEDKAAKTTKETKETGRTERGTKEEKEKKEKDAGISEMGMKEAAAADIALQQMRSRRNVISGMENDITILQGEIRQDEARGANVEEKQAALKKQEEKVQKASASQFSVLDNTYKVIVDATRANADGSKGTNAKNVKSSSESDALIKSTNFAKEKNQSPQPFYTSFTLFG